MKGLIDLAVPMLHHHISNKAAHGVSRRSIQIGAWIMEILGDSIEHCHRSFEEGDTPRGPDLRNQSTPNERN